MQNVEGKNESYTFTRAAVGAALYLTLLRMKN